MPNARRKKASRLGDTFGGLIGNAVKSLRGRVKPAGQKGKKKLSRKQILDNIMNGT